MDNIRDGEDSGEEVVALKRRWDKYRSGAAEMSQAEVWALAKRLAELTSKINVDRGEGDRVP